MVDDRELNMTLAKQPHGDDKAWLRRAKDATHCEGCGKPNDETIVACHLRHNDYLGQNGTGMKPHDAFTVLLCYDCHNILDGRTGAVFDRYRLAMTLLRKLAWDRWSEWKVRGI